MNHLFRAIRGFSNSIADAAGHPAAQIGILIACILWWVLGGSLAVLGSAVSIGGFVLTQMVLNPTSTGACAPAQDRRTHPLQTQCP